MKRKGPETLRAAKASTWAAFKIGGTQSGFSPINSLLSLGQAGLWHFQSHLVS